MSTKKVKDKFKFEGYDSNGDPIIKDNGGKKFELKDPPPPEVNTEPVLLQVYSWNPT